MPLTPGEPDVTIEQLPTVTLTSGTTALIGTGAGVTTITNDTEWRKWNQIYTLTTTSCSAGSCTNYQIVNGGWPFNTTNTATTASTTTWTVWSDRYERIMEAGGHAMAAQISRYSRRKLTEEELLVELEREKKMREEAEKRALAAKLAEKRAEELLRACLSEKQIDDLEKRNCFYVEIEGRSGKKERYRIDRGSHGNVKQIDERGSIIRSFCIQPSGVPNGDVLLTQKLWLEASEATREEFWATANITSLIHEKAIPATVPRHERRRYAEMHGLLH
jgi:hypothetical protein